MQPTGLWFRWYRLYLLVLLSQRSDCLVSWGCRIHRLCLCRGVRTPPARNECPGYDTKQPDGEVPVMLWLWRRQSTPALLSLPGPLEPGVVASDWVLSMGQIELNCQTELLEIELFLYSNCILMLNWVVWNKTILTLNCVWTKTILILNWIVGIRTVWLNWIALNRNVFEKLSSHLNCVLTLNWIVWNGTFLYAKLNCFKRNCFWHLNCTYVELNCLK